MKETMQKEQTYKIVAFKGNRFKVVDMKNNLITDANGQGFKTKQSAHKYTWYILNEKNLETRKENATKFIEDNPEIKDYAYFFDMDNILFETKSNEQYNPWKAFLKELKTKNNSLYEKLCANLKLKNSVKKILVDSCGFI